eukprot:TRINITY_DN27350_c0_g1_i2.p3 TRINITY_DN27350_c0_g1~~TRINITY_DN27350_c0_g1_i2.p3  ORF type:complete len:206 (-),score=-12.72 TRINITY_DN27350_c0_g1_i2:986-1603(-)
MRQIVCNNYIHALYVCIDYATCVAHITHRAIIIIINILCGVQKQQNVQHANEQQLQQATYQYQIKPKQDNQYTNKRIKCDKLYVTTISMHYTSAQIMQRVLLIQHTGLLLQQLIFQIDIIIVYPYYTYFELKIVVFGNNFTSSESAKCLFGQIHLTPITQNLDLFTYTIIYKLKNKRCKKQIIIIVNMTTKMMMVHQKVILYTTI